jgi:hypothetical protein
MFEEKDNQLDLEVKFIEAYQSLLKKLRDCVESRQTDTEQVVSTSSGRKTSTMEVSDDFNNIFYIVRTVHCH